MAKIKSSIPDNISEEYYQISQEILSSFSKYRPPIDLFKFDESIHGLYPLHRKGQRLTNEQIDEINRLCDEGELFVSRTDHPIYSEHIVNQVDLILVDANLKESESADILVRALAMRFESLCEQPIKIFFDALYKDVLVFTEYLSIDKYRVRSLLRRIYKDEYSLAKHSVNTLILGAWVYLNNDKEIKRKTLDRLCLALLVHDIGMSKIPSFILTKTTQLKSDERDKIILHPLVGAKVMQKCDVMFDELLQVVMQHHERLDGTGYPQKVKDISPFGKLAAVVDSLSAMIQKRAYADKKELGVALKELLQDKRYDTSIVTQLNNAFLTGAFELPQQKNT